MDSFVQLSSDSSGSKIQMSENTIGGNVVEAMAISAVDCTGYSDSFVEVAEGQGKKMQYFQNTVGSNSVVALAVVLVDSTGASI